MNFDARSSVFVSCIYTHTHTHMYTDNYDTALFLVFFILVFKRKTDYILNMIVKNRKFNHVYLQIMF